MTWWFMGSTTSCNGSCFQWAIPAPEESNATRNGSVWSTRAISASAARRPVDDDRPWLGSDAAGGFSRAELCEIGLLIGRARLRGLALAPERDLRARREAIASFAPVRVPQRAASARCGFLGTWDYGVFPETAVLVLILLKALGREIL
jgi:hypothetical protein